MNKFIALLLVALCFGGVAFAADITVQITDEADIAAVVKLQRSCDERCDELARFRARVRDLEAAEAKAKEDRAKALSALATKLGVTGKSYSIAENTTKVGDGVPVKTYSLVASQ